MMEFSVGDLIPMRYGQRIDDSGIDTNNVGAGNTASQDPTNLIKVIIQMMVLIMKLV